MHYFLSLKSKKNNHSNTKKSGGGFTLLEVLVALFVIIVGLMGGMSAILKTLTLLSFSASRLTAAYLAQEGIEIVRNVRDTNWLEARTVANDWDEGLANCSNGCIADYNHSYGPDLIDPNLPAFASQFLNIGGNGFYSYSPSTETKFKRKITITTSVAPECPTAGCLSVKVDIFWSEKGKPYTFSTQENLYNWR